MESTINAINEDLKARNIQVVVSNYKHHNNGVIFYSDYGNFYVAQIENLTLTEIVSDLVQQIGWV